MRALLSFVGFQGGWFACVLGAAAGRGLLGPFVVAVVGAVHVAFARRKAALAVYAAGAALAGFALDSVLAAAGWLRFPAAGAGSAWSSLWMAAMWSNFALVVPPTLGWLRGRPCTAAALGATGGPLAYLAGERLGAVELDGAAALGAVAAEWAAATPLLVAWSRTTEAQR